MHARAFIPFLGIFAIAFGLIVTSQLNSSTSRIPDAAARMAKTIIPSNEPEHSAMSSLGVMSFNLRYEGGDPPPNDWKTRLPAAMAVIREHRPHLIGTQEGLYGQVQELAAELGGTYEWLGEGREGGSAGEMAVTFYRPARLQPLAYGSFWLSDTPMAVGSIGWGADLPRMVFWIEFLDLNTNRTFFHFNTHFSHVSESARLEGAKILQSKIAEIAEERPVVVTGDFNATQESEPYRLLLSGQASADSSPALQDAFNLSARPYDTTLSTFHGWLPPNTLGQRIDWILVSPDWTVAEADILTDRPGGIWPSDHFPVTAKLNLHSTAQ